MLRMVLTCAALASAVVACAPFSQTNITPEQKTAENTICAQVMEIWTGDVYYSRCQEAVGHVLAAETERQAAAAARKTCTGRGFPDGTAEFSSCMQDIEAKPTSPMRIGYPGGEGAEPGLRFDNVSFPVRTKREQYACAQLGLLPGSGAYEDCVADLEDALIPNKY